MKESTSPSRAPVSSSMEAFPMGDFQVVVLAGPEFERLTLAERAVVGLAAAGLSNPQIASARGSATRTVANQLASAFRKVGVGSRFELAARLRRAPDPTESVAGRGQPPASFMRARCEYDATAPADKPR